jgi:hypothetical protein
MAGVTAALTSDTDEAESWLRERLPASLVLDQGLPRMTVFRLYGLVRAEESMRGISVLFVGQEGQGGAEDHYLPADASPLVVAAQAQQLAARRTPTDESEAESAATTAPDLGTSTVGRAEDSQPKTKELWPPPVLDASSVPVVVPRRTDDDGDAVDDDEVAPAPAKRGRRLDVILFQVGVVLLILGLAAVWLNPFPASPVAAPPTAVPTAPTRPPASPSPAALAVPPMGLVEGPRSSR